jgi:methionyl-tRNA formyltransferase
MKIVVICNTDSLAIPVLKFLHTNDFLMEVGIPENHAAILIPSLQSIGIEQNKIHVLCSEDWKISLQKWLDHLKPDMVWVFAFPWRIPSHILSIPRKGFFNFHFGALPKYRGADPIFWQIKNRETKSELTIHLMTEKIDEGPVLFKQEMSLLPGTNYGIVCQHLGNLAVDAVAKFTQHYQHNHIEAKAQQANGAPSFDQKPGTTQLSIQWTSQTAEEIESLVNACNPRYGGASTFIRNMEVRILEVSPITITDAAMTSPGTIIHADAVYGLVVSCLHQQYLRINIVHMQEGYFSGIKLFNMGLQKGEQFFSRQLQSIS